MIINITIICQLAAVLSRLRHISEHLSKIHLILQFRPLRPTYRNKLLKMPFKQTITARNYLLHSFVYIPVCKIFTKTTGINILQKMQFSNNFRSYCIFFRRRKMLVSILKEIEIQSALGLLNTGISKYLLI